MLVDSLKVFAIVRVLENFLVVPKHNVPPQYFIKLLAVQRFNQSFQKRQNAAAKHVILVFVCKEHLRYHIEAKVLCHVLNDHFLFLLQLRFEELCDLNVQMD